MAITASTLVFLAVTLGANALVNIFVLMSHEGLPGRRLGGGTRHNMPSLQSTIDA